MDIRESVFDRIEDSVVLFKNNFIGLFLPFFLYNFISIVIIGTVSKYYMMNSLSGINMNNSLDFFTFLNNPTVVLIIVLSVFIFILYLLVYIFVFLGLLKSIKQILNNEKIDILDNIKYGFSHFYLSMKTYWYIFAYIALIPALLFIIGGTLFNISYFVGGFDYLKTIGGGFMIVGLIIFIVFSVYRGLKTKFALCSAVNSDEFTKNNFLSSILYTDNNWWRILGNFFLVGILVSLISSLIGGIFGMISFGMNGGVGLIESLSTSVMTKNPELIKASFDQYLLNFSITGEIFSNIINNIITTIASVFIIIFTYLFYIRLGNEHNDKGEKIMSIELENQDKIIEL